MTQIQVYSSLLYFSFTQKDFYQINTGDFSSCKLGTIKLDYCNKNQNEGIMWYSDALFFESNSKMLCTVNLHKLSTLKKNKIF